MACVIEIIFLGILPNIKNWNDWYEVNLGVGLSSEVIYAFNTKDFGWYKGTSIKVLNYGIHYFINMKLFWRDNFVVVCLLLGCDWSHKGFCVCDIRIPSDIVIWKSLQVYRHFLISFPFWTCFCICPLLHYWRALGKNVLTDILHFFFHLCSKVADFLHVTQYY